MRLYVPLARPDIKCSHPPYGFTKPIRQHSGAGDRTPSKGPPAAQRPVYRPGWGETKRARAYKSPVASNK